jgi:hypothetical protein
MLAALPMVYDPPVETDSITLIGAGGAGKLCPPAAVVDELLAAVRVAAA